MTKYDQILLSRLQALHAEVRSGAAEMTGKTYRDASGKVAGRFKGGFSTLYPELGRAGMTPGQAAAAIEKGKGKPLARLVEAAKVEVEREYGRAPRKRSPRRPVVPAQAGNRHCVHCRVAHPKGQHRFHGAGSFHQTHLFGFNPNPPTVIYDATRGVVIQGMRKGPRSKFPGQVFRHRFKEPVEIIGLPNGDVLLRSKKK